MKLPKLFAACDDCYHHDVEGMCWPTEQIAWSHSAGKWLCENCWGEYDQDPESPLVYAKDGLPDDDDQRGRLIAAATKKRLGVA
jgi:hypothetical protein